MNNHNARLQKLGDARYKRFRRMREQGMTMEAIALIEGCSKQRIDQILKRGLKNGG